MRGTSYPAQGAAPFDRKHDPMETHSVDLDVTGEKMPSYVAAPDGVARGGVIVVQEIFGVNDDMRRIADLLASVGFLAIVPAIFHRTDPHFAATHDEAGFARGRAAAGAVDLQQLVADLTAAADYLRGAIGADGKIATWGFCFGGSVAFMSATLPFVDGAVSFYGGQIATSPAPTRPPMLAMAEHLRAPLFLAFGGRDPYVTHEHVATIERRLDALEKPFESHTYADEDHGFFREGPQANDGARDVWPRVRAFLDRTLTHA